MVPGIYYDIPAEKYHACAGISKHGLDSIARSPLHYWSYFLDPLREAKKDTPATVQGTAIHCAVLEPERFDATYVCEPEANKFPGALDKLDEYKAACKKLGLPVSGTKAELKKRLQDAGSGFNFYDDLYEEYTKGKVVLSPAEWWSSVKIAKSIRSHPTAKEIFDRGAGKSEVSIFWIDPDYDVLCRARLDWLTDWGTIADLKSTPDARPDRFIHSVVKHRYWVQAAFYLDGYKLATGKTAQDFVFAAWEKQPPYASAFYYATPELIEEGRKEYKRLLGVYKKCLTTDVWPGYDSEVSPLYLPEGFQPATADAGSESKDWLDEMEEAFN